MRDTHLRIVLLTAVAPVAWGTTYLVTTEMLPEGRPFLAATLRTLPAGLLLLALTRTLPRGDWWWRAAVLGALNIGLFQALLFVTAYRLPGGVAATFGAASPVVVAAFAAWWLGERATRWRLGWGVVGIVGVALVVLRPGAALDGWGVAAGAGNVLAMAAGTVLVRRWARPVGLLAFTGWQLTLGGLLLAPLTLVLEGLPPALDTTAVVGYLWLGGVGSVLAYVLWFRGLALLPVTQVAFLPLLSPVVAAVLGWLVLDQVLTPVQGAGFALALASIVAAQRTPRPAAAAPPAPAPARAQESTVLACHDESHAQAPRSAAGRGAPRVQRVDGRTHPGRVRDGARRGRRGARVRRPADRRRSPRARARPTH